MDQPSSKAVTRPKASPCGKCEDSGPPPAVWMPVNPRGSKNHTGGRAVTRKIHGHVIHEKVCQETRKKVASVSAAQSAPTNSVAPGDGSLALKVTRSSERRLRRKNRKFTLVDYFMRGIVYGDVPEDIVEQLQKPKADICSVNAVEVSEKMTTMSASAKRRLRRKRAWKKDVEKILRESCEELHVPWDGDDLE